MLYKSWPIHHGSLESVEYQGKSTGFVPLLCGSFFEPNLERKELCIYPELFLGAYAEAPFGNGGSRLSGPGVILHYLCFLSLQIIHH
jgi:hypothetical protein